MPAIIASIGVCINLYTKNVYSCKDGKEFPPLPDLR